MTKKSNSSTLQTTRWNASDAAKYAFAEDSALDKDAAIQKKYVSISSLNKTEKIDALKNTQLNPYLLDNSYDALSNSMHRWTVVAKDAETKGMDNKAKFRVASNYYDKMIAPMYGADPWQLHAEPMNKKLWMTEAYKKAKEYDINDAYENNYVHAMRQGWHSGMSSMREAGATIYSALGHLISTPKQHTDEEYSPWFVKPMVMHNSPEADPKNNPLSKKYFAAAAELRHSETDHDFWSHSLPTHGTWLENATSMVAEQATQLPMYAAMSEGGGIVKGANLTEKLATSKLGQYVFKSLMAGTEGLAYGVATRKQDDKNQAWRDAVGFMAFHQVFEFAGAAKGRLFDVVPKDSKLGSIVARRAETLDLAQKGLRRATPDEKYEQHVQHESSVMAVSGIPGVQSKLQDAIIYQRAIEERGIGKEALQAIERKHLEEDPARWAPLLASTSYIRSVVGKMGKRLTDIKPGSEEAKSLEDSIGRLVGDAATRMNSSSAPVIEETAQSAAKDLKEPSAKNTKEYYKAKVLSQIAKMDPAAQKMIKPEQVEKMVDQEYAKGVLKAAKVAEDKGSDKVGKAVDAAKRRKDKPGVEVRSERSINKKGEPSVRYSVNPDYKIQLEKHKQDAKESGKTLAEFYQDMDDEDFGKDITDHFYPAALKQAQVFFEHQNTREGVQNPNFLGFMYNYKDQMPKEIGQELENRLIDTMKVQKYMSGKKPTTPQLMYFSKAMYNHVDNFLGSGSWPGEYNIFRSTQEDLWHSTAWQQELLVEKMRQEEKNIKEMFPDLGPKRQALSTLRILQQQRLGEYFKGPKDMKSQSRIADIDTKIADHQTQTGMFERIPF